LVGESGSGKTSLGKAMLGAAPISSGGVNITTPKRKVTFGVGKPVKRKHLARTAQLVFQDPYSSLNPRMTARDIIAEPLEAMRLTKSREETDQKVIEVAKRCHIEKWSISPFPHAFQAGSDSVSASPGRWSASQNSLLRMNRSPPWMCRFKPRF